MLEIDALYTCDDDPPESHCWDNHDQQAFRMFPHIGTWELNSDGEEASGKNDSHHLEGDFILFGTPRPGTKDVGNVRANEYTKTGTKDDFIDIKLSVVSVINLANQSWPDHFPDEKRRHGELIEVERRW